MTDTTVVVVPCFDEARRLDSEAFLAFVSEHADVKFLFVDDGSSDGTLAALRALASCKPTNLMVMALDRNQGKSEAVRRGLLEALALDPTYVGYLDADLAAPVTSICLLRQALRQNEALAIVCGSRAALRTRRLDRRLRTRLFAVAARRITRLDLDDTQCGAKLLRVEPSLPRLLATPFLSRWAFDVELLCRLARDARHSGRWDASRVAEVPIVWRDVAGSKLDARAVLVSAGDLVRLYLRER